MAIPNKYIDKIKDKDSGESRPICPPAEHVQVDNENFEGDTLDEVLDEVAQAIEDAGQGGYAPPQGGIPKTDLAQSVQCSLDKADSALQDEDVAEVAKTGDYNDLGNKPTIPDTSNLATKTELNTKQDTLVAGNGIVIANDGKTVSVAESIRTGAAAGATAVQESDLNSALAGKQNVLTFDDAPTAGSDNPVKSKGIKTALENLLANIRIYNNEWYIGNTPTGVPAQGPQGNTQILDPTTFNPVLQIINNLIDGGSGDALSAEMGKFIATYLELTLDRDQEIDLSIINSTVGWIAPTDNSTWTTHDGYTCKLFLVTPGTTIRIKAYNDHITMYSFLTQLDVPVDGAVPNYADGYNKSVKVNAGEQVTVNVPVNAAYMYISAYSTDDRLPESIVREASSVPASTISQRLSEYVKAEQTVYDFSIEDESGNSILIVDGGHIKTKNFDSSNINVNEDAPTQNKWEEKVPCIPVDNTKPQHLGQINVIRKALQQCNIKWTPVRSGFAATHAEEVYDMVNGRKYFKQGVEYTGIPYTSPNFLGRAVGTDVSVETFMTAVKNPNSVLYTEDLRDYNVPGGVGPYYGGNCSSFTNAVQGIQCVCRGRNNNFAGNRILESPQNAEALQIGDVIYLTNPQPNSGHTIAVIGIEKDEHGFITKIIEAEQDGKRAKVYEYTKEQFEQRFFFGGYGIQDGWAYRNTELVDNTDFTQMFVGVYDESGEIPYPYSETIGINIGNKANFNKAENREIEITFLSPSTMNSFSLYKGTTLIGSYNASGASAGFGSTKIYTIDKSVLDAGTYEVRPSDGGVSQYFCVADSGTVAKTYDDKDNLVVVASGFSSNVKPYAVVIISSDHYTRGLWKMDGESSVTIPKEWLEFIDYANDLNAFRVVYRNEFGNIFTEEINL